MAHLTGECARKFERQVRYGRPKAAALEATARGVEMARQMRETGYVRVTLEDMGG